MIVVTGCTGFIGFHLSKKLLFQNIPVIGIDTLDSLVNPLHDWRLKQLRGNGLKFLDVDITNKAKLNKRISEENIQKIPTVYHLAGLAGVRQSVENPKKYYENNIIGTLNMLNIATKFSSQSFILASSSSIYGSQNNNKMPFIENETEENPQSPYAFSKLFAEIVSRNYTNISSLNVSSLRFFTVYGPAGRIDMSILKFIHKIINEETINLFGDGSQERDFTYVEDICDGIISSSKLEGFQTLNLGSSKPYSLIDVLKILEKIIKKESKIEYFPKHYADVDYTWANINKAKSLLNWYPKISLEDGLEKTVIWYKNNQKWLYSIFD